MSEETFVFKVPEDTGKLASDCVDQLTAELGESPEAWRGATEMCQFLHAWGHAFLESVENPAELLHDDRFLLPMLVTWLISTSKFNPHKVEVDDDQEG